MFYLQRSLSALRNYNYEVLVCLDGLRNSSVSDSKDSYAYISANQIQYLISHNGNTGRNVGHTTNIIVSTNKEITFEISNNKYSSLSLYAIGYRRIGTNS